MFKGLRKKLYNIFSSNSPRMGLVRLLSLCTLLLSFVQQTSGQSPKTPAMWNIQLATEYPNPMINDSRCKLNSDPFPIRICDPNRVFSPAEGDRINSELKGLEGLLTSNDKCLCNQECLNPRIPTIVMIVVLMQSLGPNIHDFWAEANALTDKFHEIWNLRNCSVVLAISKNDKRYYIDPSQSVINFLTWNVTDDIDKEVHGLFINDKPEEGVFRTVSLYREALNRTAMRAVTEIPETPTTPDPPKPPITAIVVAIVIFIIIIIIIILIVIYMKKRGNSGKKGAAKESKDNESGRVTEPLKQKI